MDFHQKSGPRALISNDKRSALRSDSDRFSYGAIVFSSQPLEDDILFEVTLNEKATGYARGLMFGVTSQRPDAIGSLPNCLNTLQQSWIFYNGFGYWNQGDSRESAPFANFDNLNVGDRVGVLRKNTGALHVYINGEEKGSAFSDVPSGCYAALDLIANIAKPAMVSIDIASWRIADFKDRLSIAADVPRLTSAKPRQNKKLKTSSARDDEKFVASQRFTHKALPGFEWFLKIYPKGYVNEACGFVAAELCVEKSGKKSPATAPSAIFSASLTSAKGESTQPISSKLTSFVGNAACVIEKFATREKVEKMCGEEGSIAVCGKIVMEGPFNHVTEAQRRAFESGGFSDFTIAVEDEPVEFAVHKVNLAEASPVFMRMLHSQCDEVENGKLTIKESSLDAVKAMLQFIYGDPLCFDGLQELSIDVLKLADQYGLSGLREMCEKSLSGMVSKANVLQFAHIADILRSANILKKAVFQFIYDNKEFMKEEDWIKFRADKNKSELVIEILDFIIAQQSLALSKK